MVVLPAVTLHGKISILLNSARKEFSNRSFCTLKLYDDYRSQGSKWEEMSYSQEAEEKSCGTKTDAIFVSLSAWNYLDMLMPKAWR